LINDDLPLGARILAIADAFDSMTSDQVDRPAMRRESAVGNLFEGSGLQFDPELTRTFVRSSVRSVRTCRS
jgi:HD-GYP domain-containing protein (c-di-GMP phosphodiesterase class II)